MVEAGVFPLQSSTHLVWVFDRTAATTRLDRALSFGVDLLHDSIVRHDIHTHARVRVHTLRFNLGRCVCSSGIVTLQPVRWVVVPKTIIPLHRNGGLVWDTIECDPYIAQSYL